MGAHTKKQAVSAARESNRDARSVLDSIRRIVRTLRVSSRQAEQDVGLSGAQLFVMQKLGDEAALSVNELAARTLTHQSSVSVVVQRLIARGFVKRAPSKKDGRSVLLSLTPAGRRVLAGAPGAAQDRIIAGLTRMPSPSRRQLAGLLERLIAESGLADVVPGMMFEEEPAASKKSKPPRKRSRNG
jgi:DNA-binding MarR family transcriptional regulator